MKHGIILISVFLFGCKDYQQKLEYDLQVCKDLYVENPTFFTTASAKMDSLWSSESSDTRDSMKRVLSVFEYQLGNKHGDSIRYLSEVDSIAGGLPYLRISPKLKSRQAHCSTLGLCYIDSGTLKVISKTRSRNVQFRQLGNNWYVEIDQSSPCIE